jgi:hypothetical protein
MIVPMDSCAHPKCQRAQNMAARIDNDSPDVPTIDLAQLITGLQPWSLSCADASVVAYRKDYATGAWYRMEISEVTTESVITLLEGAVRE